MRVVLAIAVASCSGRAMPAAHERDDADVAPAEAVAPAPTPAREAPIASPAVPDWAAHQAALARVVSGAQLVVGSDPFAFIDSGDAPPWRFVPLVPEDAATSLASVWRRAGEGRVRVAMYGASGTAADTHTASVRGYLQHRFGDGGPGWIPLGKATRWSRHTEATITASKGWSTVHAVRDGEGDGRALALGPAGVAFDGSRKGVRVSVALRREQPTSLDRLELVMLAQPGGGRVRVAVDGGAAVVHATSADAPRLLTLPLVSSSPRPRVEVEVVGDGPVRVFGIAVERARGVVVDTLGVDGARARNWRRWDDAVWSAAIEARPPDVVTLAYGTNEAVDGDADTRRFEEDFTALLVRVRERLPHAVCIVLGPGDFPVAEGSRFVPRPRLVEIAALERTLALRHGCAFWDELAFMGGPGSMPRWVQTEPPAARDDHLHFTPLGAAIKGHYLAAALVVGSDAGL